jgi:CDP-glucose 4,6-dehydratase
MNLEKIFKNKRVLITGITGFKGSWLAIWLKKLGADVYGCSNNSKTEPSMFDSLGLEKQIKNYQCEIRNFSEVHSIIKKVNPDFVFHSAAQPITGAAYTQPRETFDINVMGTINVLDALRVINRPCVGIFITSDKCYENKEWDWGYRENDEIGGKDPYSASKGASEIAIRSYNHSFFSDTKSKIRIASVRSGNVIGGGDWNADRIVPDCMRAWQNDKTVTIRSPYSIRPWQHVLESLSGYLTVAGALYQKKINSGEAFNFGPPSDSCISVEKLIEELSKEWGQGLPKQYFKIQKGKPFFESSVLKLNCDKALAKLAWKPRLNISGSVSLTVDWYKTYHDKSANMLDFTLKQIKHFEEIEN